MREEVNEVGQVVGFSIPGWTKRPRPPRTPKIGRFCRVEPLDTNRHAVDPPPERSQCDAHLEGHYQAWRGPCDCGEAGGRCAAPSSSGSSAPS
jgi:hypothetical protein